MKQTVRILILLCLATGVVNAQSLQFFRPNNQGGLNIFESKKNDTTKYDGFKLRIGGGFTQDYQALKSSNTADYVITSKTDSTNKNQLMDLTSGFNLAMANMMFDAQLEDGVRLNLTLYLSSRHHSETWVKSGYVQIDKLNFLGQGVGDMMEDFSFKVGHLEVNYGDQHFRRTDGGNSMFNPFVENYIMDAFATEVGTEIYYHVGNTGLMAMVGVSDGMLNPTVIKATGIDAVTKETNTFEPALYGKLAYDSQINDDLRLRLSGSAYNVSSSNRNTLYAGDRTGSHYFLVMENNKATAAANMTSGRFDPGFSDQITAIQINPFVKFMGLEVFGAFETATGRSMAEVDKRKATQLAAEALYRFGSNEDFWIGGRFNNVDAELLFDKVVDGKATKVNTPVKLDRLTVSAGWFVTKNLLLKGEYVQQNYKDFPTTDIRNGGKFDGAVISAVLAF